MVAHCALADINSIPHWAAEKQFSAPRIPRPQLPVQADTQCKMEKGLQRHRNDIDSEVIVVCFGEEGAQRKHFPWENSFFLKEDEFGTLEHTH